MKTETLVLSDASGFIYSVNSDIWWFVVVMQPLKGDGLSCSWNLQLKKTINSIKKRGMSLRKLIGS